MPDISRRSLLVAAPAGILTLAVPPFAGSAEPRFRGDDAWRACDEKIRRLLRGLLRPLRLSEQDAQAVDPPSRVNEVHACVRTIVDRTLTYEDGSLGHSTGWDPSGDGFGWTYEITVYFRRNGGSHQRGWRIKDGDEKIQIRRLCPETGERIWCDD